MTSGQRTARVSRDLSQYIPSPDTRAFIGRVFRAWGVEWAAVLTEAIAEGVLIDMGMIQPRVEGEVYAHTHKHGTGESERGYLVNQRTGKCWFCGQVVLADEPNPAQMALGSQVQLKMEVR